MTQYAPSLLIAEPAHQELATGFPIGKRFKSAPVVRVCDTNPMHLGHHAKADGRWRIYVFADAAPPPGDRRPPSRTSPTGSRTRPTRRWPPRRRALTATHGSTSR